MHNGMWKKKTPINSLDLDFKFELNFLLCTFILQARGLKFETGVPLRQSKMSFKPYDDRYSLKLYE